MEQQALSYTWLRRMHRKISKSVHGGQVGRKMLQFHAVRLIVCQGTVNEVTFDGIASPIRIALKVGSFGSITAI